MATSSSSSSSQEKPALRKAVFVKVECLKPGTQGHNLVVKVVSVEQVLKKGQAKNASLRNTRVSECLVGDDTAAILFTARNDQVDVMKPGTSIIVRNAKIDMYKDTMRLAVDKWGRIEITEPVKFEVMKDNNLSLIEYELVTVAPPKK